MTNWNLYADQGEAEGVLTSDTEGRIAAHFYPGTAAVMHYDEFKAAQKAEMIADAQLEEINEERYKRALGELPPMKWETVEGVERFLHAEYAMVPYTYQYAAKDGRYFASLVDATDPETWITASKIDDLLTAENNDPSSAFRP